MPEPTQKLYQIYTYNLWGVKDSIIMGAESRGQARRKFMQKYPGCYVIQVEEIKDDLHFPA